MANGRLFVGDTKGVVHAYTYPSSPGAGSSATASASAARVALAQGCQTIRQPAPSGSRVRVTRLGKATAAATIAVFRGRGCTGTALTRRRLRGGDRALLKVPRWLATGSRISLRSSRAMRLKLGLARWGAAQR